MIPPKKKQNKSNEEAFANEMNKQLMQSGRWKTDSPISDKEQDEAEKGKSPEDLKEKAKKQIEEKEKMKESIRQNASDKSKLVGTIRKIVGK